MSSPSRFLWAAVLGMAGVFALVGPTVAQTGLQFNGTTQYVTFGSAAALGTAQFTLEVWVRRTGTGVQVATGTGGLTNAIPLVTKGRGEGETPANLNMNYFLGLNNASSQGTLGVVCADFENNAGGGNHPVLGVTPVLADGVWHHVAATYDGTTWRLYLDGVLDRTLVVNATPEASSIQHAGLGTAMTSTGAPAGFFAGDLDEARIWNVARSQCEIIGSMNLELTSGTGLIGRWGLNDGAGTTAANSIGGSPDGTLTPTGTPPAWVAGSPFNAPVPPLPDDPTGLAANAPNPNEVQLGWTDVATTESGYEVERSIAGSGGPFSLLASLGPGSTGYQDFTVEPSTPYWYRVRATGSCGNSGYTAVETATTPAEPCNALAFNPTANGGYVALGQAPSLGATTFTLETWFKRTGTGIGTNTGSGGLNPILPLISKGMAEADGSTADMNYLFGIYTGGANPVIAADFEEGTGQTSPGLNHPVQGVTPILTGTWYHAAATFDGTTFRLYLNGTLEATVVVGAGRLPQSGSVQHAAIASALGTGGTVPSGQTQGFFAGQLDEVRIWNVARTESEIQATINSQISAPTSNLIGRWGMNEITGTTVIATAGTTTHGTLVGSQPTQWDRVPCAPFNVSFDPPTDPSALSATTIDFSRIDLTWMDASTNETGFEIERSTTGIGGVYSFLASVGPNTTTYSDTGLQALSEYCYRVRAVNGNGASGYAGPSCATTQGSALDFGSAATTYVSFGDPAALHLSTFTVETWFRRDGAGTFNTTGSSGIPQAIPLVTKGAPESDNSNVDANYILCIDNASGALAADYEEGAGQASPGLNHPIIGSTALTNGVWYHGAVTFDGTTLRLYLNGNLDATVVVGAGRLPRFDSIQRAALATMLRSGTQAPLGFFDGALDEVRVWDFARTQAEIQSTANVEIITPTVGLVARWALDEGTGTAINGSAGTAVNGTITSADYTWTAGAPFDLSFTAPDAPTGLAATATTHSQISLSWNDLSTNESGFEIERSTTGIGGAYSLLATVIPNTTSYNDGGLSASAEYCYRVRAVNGSGQSAYTGPECATTLAPGNTALGFSGSAAQPSYASFGTPAALQLTAFTIEMWMRRDGAGEGTNTGSGGIPDAIPLVAKGRADTETPTADINYLFGIRASSGALCADFEEGAAGGSPSLNHPIEGGTPLAMGTWYHVAATYDGTALKLYLDGILDASIDVGQPLASASTVAVAIASALTSAGDPAGFFDGVVDEVRIWNVARSQAQIQSTANVQMASPTTGLVARWSMDEGSGTAVGASAGTTANGTITGPNYAWSSPGAPFDLAFNQQPGQPVLVGPANGATGVSTSPTLEITASDPDGGNLTVTYYGRTTAPTPGPDFTLIGLPDTQYYTGLVNGGTLAMFESQTNWIVANRVSRNIVYVGQLGDCVERGDNGGSDAEWIRADQALSIIENPITTGLTDGIPFGVSVGNHDQSPIGDADGTTTFYNQYFGTARFTGRNYYGGNYGVNNDNWYELFSASGMDFIVISFEYDTTPDAAVLAWADNLLATNSTRRAIILSHFICNTGNPGGFGPQGQAIYDALKSRPNLDLMLCGHVPGEGRRQDTFNGNTVHTMLSDYQGRANGGSGWLRILEFSPANNEIRVKTYSPWLDLFENDGDSEFTLPYPMTSSPAFQPIGTVASVPSGSNSSLVWPGLTSSTDYEWYATVSDGSATTVSPVWSFTTGTGGATHTITATAGSNGTIAPSGTVIVNSGADQLFTFTPDPGYHVSTLTVDAVAIAVAPSYTFTNVTADHTIDVQFSLNPAVDPVANLVATQVVPGTLGESTTPIQLTWDATPGGTTVEVWRKGFGGYPEYDDGGGAIPTVSSSYPPGAGWVKVDGLTTPGSDDLTSVRDFYYYVAYAQDGLGTWSPTSVMTDGTVNYHLSDVTDGTTPGAGNNTVNSVDVSLLGSFYGVSGGAVAPVNYLDVGPTSTGYVDGRPLTDDAINFEDLVMFALNYGLGVTGPATPAGRRAAVIRSASTSSSAELVLEAPGRVSVGDAVTARLMLRTSGTLIAVSARLEWDPAVVEPVSHAAGAWLIEREGLAFSPTPGTVDAAVMGGGVLVGEGDLASVRFRVLSAGDPKVRVAALAGRDVQNRPVMIGSVLRPSSPVIPLRTGLAFARPNPFRESVTLGISLAKPGPVELAIYGVDGRMVRTLMKETREAGELEVVWDGRDEHGVAVRMGVFYARLVTQQGRFTRRVTNLK